MRGCVDLRERQDIACLLHIFCLLTHPVTRRSPPLASDNSKYRLAGMDAFPKEIAGELAAFILHLVSEDL